MSNRPLVPANVERLSPYVPGKPLTELARDFGITDAVKLASNESPLGPSPKAIAAATAAIAEGHRYPDGYALRRAIALHHGVPIEEVILGNGSNELIDIICHTFASPGEHAVYPDPSFVCYRSSTIAANMEPTVVPMSGGVNYDVDALIAALRPDTKLLFLANPNNPTGTYLGQAELKRLLSAAPQDAIIVLDEAYIEFADAADYPDGLKLRSLHPHILVLRTFSKAYGLAGFRVGYAIGPKTLIGYLDRLRPPFNVNNMALAAAEASLADPEHLRRYVALNAQERQRVGSRLLQLGISVVPSQANFLLVDTGRPAKDVYNIMLRKGVIVRPMAPPIESFVRITLGLPAENDRMLDALHAATTG